MLFALFAIVGLSLSISYLFFPFSNCTPISNFYLGGIQVNEPDLSLWTKQLKEVGMNTVSVTVYAKQGDWDSDNIWYDETNEGVVTEIATAKKANLNVVFIPRVALDHAFERNQFYWHGMIYPISEKDLAVWFEKYTAFLKKWAVIAQEHKVDVMAIGSEMNLLTATTPIRQLPNLVQYYLNKNKQKERKKELVTIAQQIDEKYLWVRGLNKNLESVEKYAENEMRQQEYWAKKVSFLAAKNHLNVMNNRRQLLHNYWVKLIQEIRTIYKGKLTYAANFDNYMEVSFWDELDMMGINAYFPLREQMNPNLSEKEVYNLCYDRWQDVLNSINRERNKLSNPNLPVLFTELGYTFRKHTTIQPWEGSGFSMLHPKKELIIWQEQSIDYQERKAAVQALYDVCKTLPTPLLQGILYWKLTTKKEHIDIEPFVLHIDQPPTDSLQAALRQFLKL